MNRDCWLCGEHVPKHKAVSRYPVCAGCLEKHGAEKVAELISHKEVARRIVMLQETIDECDAIHASKH